MAAKATKETKEPFLGGTVVVRKKDLAHLTREVTQLKRILPMFVNKQIQSSQTRLFTLEKENEQLKKHCQSLTNESQHWKARCDTALSDTQTEKQECLKVQMEMQELAKQLSQQSEYCASLGSACCTLLWRVSRQEDGVQAMLAGTKVDEFLSLVVSTLQSYLVAYHDDWPPDGADETQFVLALCGIITNIAASAYGREYLSTNSYGRQVLDTYIQVLSEAPMGKSSRLKNLTVMCLYNVSINQKGIKYLVSKQGLMSRCAWLLQGEPDSDLRLNCLKLIQSLMCEPNNWNAIHELNEVLSYDVLVQFTKDVRPEIRELALELIGDLSNAQISNET